MNRPLITPNPQGTGYMAAGKLVFAKIFTKTMSFHHPEGLAAVADETGAYHITQDGEPLYPHRYLEAYGFYNGLASVRDEFGFFHINALGTPVHQNRFAWSGNFQEGLCAVKTQEGYCHIDMSGTPVYANRYCYVGDFRQGVAVVHTANGAFHIRQDGSRLSSAIYRDADPFHKGYAVVSDESGYFHVGKEGQPAHPYRYRRAEPYYNGVARCIKHDGRQVFLHENSFYTYVSEPDARIEVHDIPELIKKGRRVALYIRHGERLPRPQGQWGEDIPLTPKGIKDAINFGTLLSSCGDCAFHTSPVRRCRQTALSIAQGMLFRQIDSASTAESNLLGSPGPFNDQNEPHDFLPDEFQSVTSHYIETGYHRGLKPLSLACEEIIGYLRTSMFKPLNIFVTHDLFVAGLQRFLGLRHPTTDNWIQFLEGVCLIEDGSLHGKWLILNGSGEHTPSSKEPS